MSSSPRSSLQASRVLTAASTGALPLAPLVTARARERLIPGCDALTLGERLDAARRQGYEESRRDALALANDSAAEVRAAQWRSTLEGLLSAATRTAANRAAVVEEVIDEAVDLAFELLRALLDEELSMREHPARDAVVRALKLAPAEQPLVIRVHPESLLAVEHFSGVIAATEVELVHDPEIEPTGCVVEAGACRIDAQIGPALERVRDALRELRDPQPVKTP